MLNPVLTAVLLIVAGHFNGIVGVLRDGHSYVCVRGVGMEIEGEKKSVSIEGDDFIILVDQLQICHSLIEDMMLFHYY